jgi:hypothetical protein
VGGALPWCQATVALQAEQVCVKLPLENVQGLTNPFTKSLLGVSTTVDCDEVVMELRGIEAMTYKGEIIG